MRVGIVCPYSFDVPGGVQFHVRDLAEHLIAAGHHVSVLAPADAATWVPPYVVACGRAVPVRFNGSVARLAFGPRTSARVTRWIDEGDFDVLHVHEPLVPSVSILALWAARCPVVATFHTSLERSRALRVAQPLVRASVERLNGRIAVSEAARDTVVTHIGGGAFVIPNGVEVARFAGAAPHPTYTGTADAPVVCFVGRTDEPRKGLGVLLDALPTVLAAVPGLRVVVIGHGTAAAATAGRPADVAAACEFLGTVSEDDKAAVLAGADVYVAPHTGGESFGMVLVEAMAAGLPVLAADLPAFAQVLDHGRAGRLFPPSNAPALAVALIDLLRDQSERSDLARAASARVRRYDWTRVTREIQAAYDAALAASPGRGGVPGPDDRASAALAPWPAGERPIPGARSTPVPAVSATSPAGDAGHVGPDADTDGPPTDAEHRSDPTSRAPANGSRLRRRHRGLGLARSRR